MSQKIQKMSQREQKCEPKGAKREPKGAKGSQKGAKREPKGVKMAPKVSQRAIKIRRPLVGRVRVPEIRGEFTSPYPLRPGPPRRGMVPIRLFVFFKYIGTIF